MRLHGASAESGAIGGSGAFLGAKNAKYDIQGV